VRGAARAGCSWHDGPVRRFTGGYLTIGTLRGIVIRAHWSTPIGAFALGGFRFRPLDWAVFGASVLLHELAHAGAARARGLEVYSADLLPIGGVCRHEGTGDERSRALIAAAGPAANALLATLALAALGLAGAHLGSHASWALDRIALANVLMVLVNLLPFPPLDGADAWKLVGMVVTSGWNAAADGSERAGRALSEGRRARRVAKGHLRAVGDEDADVDEEPTVH
jgi:Zn-dependent protease